MLPSSPSPALPPWFLTRLPDLSPPQDPFYEELFSRKPELKMKLGLEGIRAALSRYGDPQRKLPVVLVAGTNGKGSTVRFLEACFRRAGLRTASYLSPHIVHPCERFRIEGKEIQEEELLPLLKELYHRHPELSFFELLTLAAFLLFREHHLDLAVMEIGLGGRLDAVNAAECVRASVITSIGFDHCEVLGNTLTAIAREKAGILRPHTPLFTGALPQEVEELYAELTRQLSVPWYRWKPQGVPPLIPPYLARNLVLAQKVSETLLHLPPPSLEVLFEERPLARFSVLSLAPLKIVDGAHNPQGAEALREALHHLGISGLTIFARIGKNKDARGILSALKPMANLFYFAQETSPEWHPGEELASLTHPIPAKVLPIPRLLKAFHECEQEALFTGSIRGLKELFLFRKGTMNMLYH